MAPGAIIGLTAVGLSGDAFAASVARGAAARQNNLSLALRNGAIFGSTEGLMCFAGWYLATGLHGLASVVDHWIALILLSIIGGRMIVESFKAEDADASQASRGQSVYMTLATAFGTSVDSAVVGSALYLSGASVFSAIIIGCVSATFSTVGFLIGPTAGQVIGKRAEMVGGFILIAIGLSIWIDHMYLAA